MRGGIIGTQISVKTILKFEFCNLNLEKRFLWFGFRNSAEVLLLKSNKINIKLKMKEIYSEFIKRNYKVFFSFFHL